MTNRLLFTLNCRQWRGNAKGRGGMEAMVQKISAALGVQQREEDHDEDINLPLKPSAGS